MRDLSNKASRIIIRVEIKCQHYLYDEPHLSWQISNTQHVGREEVAPNFSILAVAVGDESLIKNKPGKHLVTCVHTFVWISLNTAMHFIRNTFFQQFNSPNRASN